MKEGEKAEGRGDRQIKEGGEIVGKRERERERSIVGMSLTQSACCWSVFSAVLLPLITSLFTSASSDINNPTAGERGRKMRQHHTREEHSDLQENVL